MNVYLKPRSADPPQSLQEDCEMLSAFICRTLDAHPEMAPHDAMRTVQAQTERVFHFDWTRVWLIVEESCEKDDSRPSETASSQTADHPRPRPQPTTPARLNDQG